MRFFILREQNLAIELFVEGLRYENDYHFEEAAVSYTKALQEVKKIRFQNKLEAKIVRKLKIVRTVIAYNNSLLFVR